MTKAQLRSHPRLNWFAALVIIFPPVQIHCELYTSVMNFRFNEETHTKLHQNVGKCHGQGITAFKLIE